MALYKHHIKPQSRKFGSHYLCKDHLIYIAVRKNPIYLFS